LRQNFGQLAATDRHAAVSLEENMSRCARRSRRVSTRTR
jgi:hypothetical protein